MGRRKKIIKQTGYLIKGMAKDVNMQVEHSVYTDRIVAAKELSNLEIKNPKMKWLIKEIEIVGRG